MCVQDRKVWKGDSNCPTCGECGKYMGPRWRPPTVDNKKAWKRIERGDYEWDKRAIRRKAIKDRLWALDFRAAMRERARKNQGPKI